MHACKCEKALLYRGPGCISVDIMYFWLITHTNLLQLEFSCAFCVVSVLVLLNEFCKSGSDTKEAHRIRSDHSLHMENMIVLLFNSVFDKSTVLIVSGKNIGDCLFISKNEMRNGFEARLRIFSKLTNLNYLWKKNIFPHSLLYG